MTRMEEVRLAHLRREHLSWTNCPWCWAERQIRDVLSAAVVSCLVLLLTAGPVWADISKISKTDELVGDDFRPIVTCNEALECWTPCQQRMKKAMQTIAPYLSKSGDSFIENAVYYPPSTRLRQKAEAIDREDAAVQQFLEVLKECA